MKRATAAGPRRYNDCSLGSKACNSSPVVPSPLEKSYMIAFDTNVLIYACDRVDPKRQCQAIELISTAADLVLLRQVACEFVAASRKLRIMPGGALIRVPGAFPLDLANRCAIGTRVVAS